MEEKGRFITKPLEKRIEAKRYRLSFALPGGESEITEIKKTPVVIGSLEGAVDICVPEPGISRLHARLEMAGGEITIEDLNSSNGTYVNDEPVFGKGKVPLKDGDMVRLADRSYRLEIYG